VGPTNGSLIVWHQLAASIGQLRLLLIGTCRPTPRRPEVHELRADVIRHGGTIVTLGPLTETDVTALVTAILGSPPGDTLRQLTAQAAGNPLYVRELVDAMVRERALEIGRAAEVSANRRTTAGLAGRRADRPGSAPCRLARRSCCGRPRYSAAGSRSPTWPWCCTGQRRHWRLTSRRRWRRAS